MLEHEWVFNTAENFYGFVEQCDVCKMTRAHYNEIAEKLGENIVKACPGYDVNTGLAAEAPTGVAGVQMYSSGTSYLTGITSFSATGVTAPSGVGQEFPSAKTARVREMERELEELRKKVQEQESWKKKPKHEPGYRKIDLDE